MQTMLVCVTGALLQLLLIFPVIGETLGNPAYTDAGGDMEFSLDLLGPLTPSRFHPLYGRFDHSGEILGFPTGERSAWIGFVAGALALLALMRRRGYFWSGAALVAWVLALGPFLKLLGRPLLLTVDGFASFLTMPQALLQLLPVVNLDRTPGRFSYLLAFAVACLATRGSAELFDHPRLKLRERSYYFGPLLLALLLIAILYDYQWFWPFPTRTAVVPAEIADLAQRNDVRAVLDVPVRQRRSDKEALWLQTAHQLPLLGGHVTRYSPANPARLQLLQDTLDPALLQIAGADIVIVHKRYATKRQIERAVLKLGPPIYADTYFAVHETPGTDAAPVQFIPPPAMLHLTGPLNIPLYTTEPGWLDLGGEMAAGRRDVVILLDDDPVDRWPAASGSSQWQSASLPLRPGAWHMVTLAAVPACPVVPSSAVECSRVALEQFEVEVLPATHAAARFAEGVELRAALVPSQALAGDNLELRMQWSFAQGRDSQDVRFVHLLDDSDQLVAQSDEAFGSIAAGAWVSDRVTLSLSGDLSPGEYSVWLGWYRYPETRRLPLIEPGGYEGDVLPLGVVRIG